MNNFSYYIFQKLIDASLESIYLVIISTILVAICGIIIGIMLFATSQNNIYENKILYSIISFVVNILRAIPFVILVIILIPITKFLVGSILGPNAAIPALVIGMTPLYAKIVETSFKEIPYGIIEVAKSQGASNIKIILKVLVPESRHVLISNLTTICITILSYSAVAGVIGAGGLGNLAYIEGFQRNNMLITIITTIIIIILVFIIQLVGNIFTNIFDKKRK